MHHYRIYQVSCDGTIVRGYDAKCESDEAACDLARRLIGLHARSEVWRGTRRVGQVFLNRPIMH